MLEDSLNCELTGEQVSFADSIRRCARDRLANKALERAHAHQYPFDIAQALAEQGLMGITMREEDGGQGGTLMDAVIAIPEVALVCPKSADIVQAGNFGPIRAFVAYATQDQKARYLGVLFAGETVIELDITAAVAGTA